MGKNFFNSTSKALVVTYGITSNLAKILAFRGTVKELKQKTFEELIELGLNDKEIARLKKNSRPPINKSVVKELFYKSRYQCVICYHTSFIIHHIDEWSKTNNHDIDNLVLLCPNCHDQAHTKGTTTNCLSAEFIRDARNKHYLRIADARDTVYLGNLYSKNHTLWYVNLQRTIELFNEIRYPIINIKHYLDLLEKRYINQQGFIACENIEIITKNKSYFIQFGSQNLITDYLKNIVERIMDAQHYLLLHKYTKLSDFQNFYNQKQLLLFKGNIVYTSKNKNSRTMCGMFIINKMEFLFEYDTFYTLGHSATLYLRGNYNSIVLIQIMSIDKNIIKCRIYFISEDRNSIVQV